MCHQICVYVSPFLVTWCYFYVKYLLGQYRLENVKPTSSDDLFTFLSSSQLEKKPQKHVLANGLLSELCLVSALENVCLLLGSYTPTGFTNALVL